MAINKLAERFEHFRQMGPKLSPSQKRWMDHLEAHLDAGDVVCRHFEFDQTFSKKEKVVCPECEQGKCRNCDGSALNPATDDIVDCECEHSGLVWEHVCLAFKVPETVALKEFVWVCPHCGVPQPKK